MKTSKIIAVALAATLFTAGFTSCGDDYDDTEIKGQITELDKRVTTLEEKVKTDIAAIQAAINTINGNDFVKSVKAVAGGYEITFSKGTVATIKNGKDGANGVKGEDGVSSVLSVKEGADGNYYWAVDGVLLKDDNDQNVPASRTPEIEAVVWPSSEGGDDKAYWQIDGKWLGGDDNKHLVTADAEPVKFNAEVKEAEGIITFKFDKADGTLGTNDYDVKIAKSDLSIVESDAVGAVAGVMFVGEENTYTVAIPEGWNADDVTVRADVASDDANATSITRSGAWTSFKVTKAAGVATIKATPASYTGDEIAELTVTMTNADGEKLTGSIFVKMAVKEALDLSSSEGAGTLKTKLEEAGKYYNAITITNVTIDGTDWAALKDYKYATSLTISNTAIDEVPADALAGNTVLTSFTGHASLATIGDNAFAGCTNLATLSTLTGVTSLGASAFEGCAKIINPTFGTLTALGANAFNGCTLFATTPTLDSGLTELPEGVFAGTALTAVSLANVTTIGDNAFKGCTALTTVTFAAATSIGASAFEDANVGGNWIFGGASLAIGDRAFAGCDFGANTLAFSSSSAIATIGTEILDGATTAAATVTLYTGSAGEPNVSGTWASTTWATVTINN